MSPFKGDQQLYGMSFCDDECSSNDDTGVPMEKSTTRTAVSTPPRSACATASRRKELFGGGNANTPKSRRLFDDDDDDTDVVIERSTAPFAAAGRRTTTKPRDPVDGANNNGIVHNDACTEDSPSSSTLSGSSSASVPGGGRKRCSAERREGGTPVPPPQRGEDIATSMYTSPRISPNSFLTMDGRFVQSKNPFSSPMMMDTPTTLEQQPVLFGTCGTAPSLPESFYGSSHLDASANDTDADARMRFLPPRHHHHPSMLLQPKQNPGTPVTEATAGLRAFSIAPAAGNSGTASYPELSRPYGFACSPIPEDIPTTATNSSNNMMMMMPMDSTDTASSGSLHKVRRIHRSDDVVAATGHHLSNFSRRVTDHPIVHTAFSDNMMDDDGISPTDVLNFPAFHATPAVPKWGPPPTPVKQRPSQQPYSSCHNSRRPQLPPRTPGPPLLARKTGMRTPHHNPSSHYDQSEETPGAMATNNGGDAQIGSSRFHADFDVIGELGHGSFGTVYKVLSRLDGCMYAIKEALRQAKGMADRDRMLKEVYALAALSDQADPANFHIVRYHQAWMEDDRLYIQTELCSGTLGDEMALGFLSMPRRYKLLREILLALDFIHRHNMVHLDIKPENIFLKNDQYKLGDFGLVTKVSGGQDVEEGDSRYMSMELLSGNHGGDLTRSDIFSLGATMYEICLGRPLPMNGQEWQDIRAGRFSPLPNSDHDMANIIRRMMEPAAAHRPTPNFLLKHPQLLSDEQKALNAEKTKVIHANIQLAAQQQRMGGPPKRPLTRANTWSGPTFQFI